ncbi:hypothetical protein BU23DRAFT_556234 [Bimuria novae-zelandiae CBS 107.79]|uniref:Diphthamide biosynthesis protein 4 n=1 Tax=Bimuria novae-zelandiae CBS 107.79 TaxID=1447943 RepID=A0A6A5V284_9PLEO|nr:hypothetical protein BU23DRAFT_556234 [Bimuria novae-zelandiae CBS 107.79]
MVFTKNYYHILGLDRDDENVLNQDALRKAYKAALLSAHPDKAASQAPSTDAYTIDDVKEALAVLADERRRREYDGWLATRGRTGGTENGALSEAFVLGLEVLDLSDFEASMPFVRMESRMGSPEVPDFEDLRLMEPGGFSEAGVHVDGNDGGDGESVQGDTNGREGEEGPGGIEWTRGCRCGAEKGFRIQERELEDAEARGETEVLVGCEGCSLWVRVGFDVEEG